MLASFFVAPSFAIDLDQSAATQASQGTTVGRSIYIVGLPARRVSTTRGFAARHFDAGGVKLTVRPKRDVTELSAFAALAPSTSIQTRQRSAAPGLPTLSAARAALVLRGANPVRCASIANPPRRRETPSVLYRSGRNRPLAESFLSIRPRQSERLLPLLAKPGR